ncbi:putative quinol monooxygenase [Undibacterium sp. TS12]|uniref:putative quinol monooxygenase n=1 Tax=Undibacterium sp. TS12 TaxID=2908202 RepID=UPI001F4C80A5|nr:putative quinol monooxygenase [Undibacterium sp. TS12]MCH8619425.1 antibiotic biosynthesis monooxygenase [Undibacterium sp. TS12]
MLTLLAEIEAQTASRDAVKQILAQLVAATEHEAGNIYYAVHQNREKPQCFIVYELYRDQAACDTHLQADYLQAALKSMDGLLAGSPTLTFYDTVATTRLPQK